MKEPRIPPWKATLALALTAIAGSGCAHTMVIETDPPEAEVAVNGEPVGTSPVITEQRTGTGGRLYLSVAADSYETADVVVTQDEWFLWPALLAATPLLGLSVVWVPFVGPVITLAWAIVTSPTLISLAFLQKYPDRVKVTLRPRLSGGVLQPTDTWLIPEDYDPNPPPLPDAAPEAPPEAAKPPAAPPPAPAPDPIPSPY